MLLRNIPRSGSSTWIDWIEADAYISDCMLFLILMKLHPLGSVEKAN